jgi:hypothetical protein
MLYLAVGSAVGQTDISSKTSDLCLYRYAVVFPHHHFW